MQNVSEWLVSKNSEAVAYLGVEHCAKPFCKSLIPELRERFNLIENSK